MPRSSIVAEQSLRRRASLLRRLAGRTSLALRVGTVGTAVLSAGGTAGQALGLKWLVDGAAQADRPRAFAGVALVAASAAINVTCGHLSVNFRNWIALQVNNAVTAETLLAIATVPTVAHLEQPEFLDEVGLVREGGDALSRSVWTMLDTALMVVQVGVTAALLAGVHPVLLLLPAFSLPQLALVKRLHRQYERAHFEAAEATRAAEHLHGLFVDVDAGMELRVFGAAAALDQRADRLFRQAARAQLVGGVRVAAWSSIGWISTAGGFVFALLVGITGASRGWASAGDVLLVIAMAAGVRSQMDSAAGTLRQLRAAARTLDRAAWLEDLVAAAAPAVAPATTVPDQLVSGIELRGVSFTYPGTSGAVLRDVDLSLRAGTIVAVAGNNGAGKTTLVKLLCGFYRPDAGTILVDGHDLRTVEPAAWCQRVSGAFQDFLNLETTLRECVGFGDFDRRHDEQEIRRALVDGNADGLLARLPDGLDTHLGKTYRDGEQLSGGQWQRVAVARAMMRRQPLLLVLDEPTAALDPAAEHALYQRYASAADRARRSGGVTLLISHRFSSVRMADRIVVLDQGRVTEQGTHDELMSAGGLYEAMFTQQATAYR